MGSMWGEDNEFFKLYNEFQQSAMYFSTLAWRQMMPRGRRGDGEETFQGYTQPEEDTGSISSAKISKKALQVPKPKPLVPVISVTEYQNVGITVSNKQKKVNFAHPLLVKSPTPVMMQMWEGGGGEGVILEDGLISHEVYGDENFSEDPSVVAVAESLAQYLSVGVCGDEDESQGQSQQEVGLTNRRRKRRSRKRRNKDNHMAEGEESQHFWDQDSFDENDPFAAFEVPLNADDYEFVSDVRCCGDKKEVAQPTVKVCDEKGQEQMKVLYGNTGSERILKMEEVIEAYFLKLANESGG